MKIVMQANYKIFLIVEKMEVKQVVRTGTSADSLVSSFLIGSFPLVTIAF